MIALLYGDRYQVSTEAIRRKQGYSRSEIIEMFVPDIEDVVRELSGDSLFGKRLVVVHGDSIFKCESERKINAFIRCMEEGRADLMVLPSKKPDSRKKLAKAFAKYEVKEYIEPYANQVAGLVQTRLKAAGRTMARDALQEFCFRVGTSIGIIDNELEKLYYVVPAGQTITLEMVREYTAKSAEASVFDIVEQVIARDPVALKNIRESQEDSFKILAMIRIQYYRLLLAKKVKGGPEQLAKELNIADYPAKIIYGQRDKFSSEYLVKGLKTMLEAQARIESGLESPENALSDAVLKILGGA